VTALSRYVSHAELYGFDADYFEIAARDLDPLDLGRLNLRLQRLDLKWRLPQDVARTLAVSIVGAGESPEWACRAAGCSRRTLNRALNGMVQVPECAPEPAFQSGEKWTNPATLGAGSYDAGLSRSGVTG
jgi:hypothetical protein